MGEDRWDPLNDVLPSPEADALGTNDDMPAPAQNRQAQGEGAAAQTAYSTANPEAGPPSDGNSGGNPDGNELPHSPESLTLVQPGVENVKAREEGGMMGGATLPNNAQEVAEDDVEESSLESFPASDPPAW